VTTQFMVKAMDAGDVLLQTEAEIGPDETAGELQDRLKLLGGRLLVETLDGLVSGAVVPRPQEHDRATFAPLLTKEQGRVRWGESDAPAVHNQVRGLTPWPGAYGLLNKKRVKLLRSRLPESAPRPRPGELDWRDGRLYVGCAGGALELLELQPEGRRAMLPEEFVNGMKGSGVFPLRFEVD
jgi:methionyl-tRNA formyltransferase